MAGTHSPLPPSTQRLASVVLDAAFTVHRRLGPGLLESVYEQCLAYELTKRSVGIERQIALPVIYDDLRLDGGYRLDIWVERSIVVEVKAIEGLAPVHTAQLLTYLTLSNSRLGYLLNFNVALLKEGVRRLIV